MWRFAGSCGCWTSNDDSDKVARPNHCRLGVKEWLTEVRIQENIFPTFPGEGHTNLVQKTIFANTVDISTKTSCYCPTKKRKTTKQHEALFTRVRRHCAVSGKRELLIIIVSEYKGSFPPLNIPSPPQTSHTIAASGQPCFSLLR